MGYQQTRNKQFSTEVRIQNLDTVALKSDIKTSGKEEAQKGKVKRETFPEFMARNPHFFSEQKIIPTSRTPLVDQGIGG